MMQETMLNIGVGVIILALNAVPLFTKPKYLMVTLPLSLLVAAIRIMI